jgi:hypothetical protein
VLASGRECLVSAFFHQLNHFFCPFCFTMPREEPTRKVRGKPTPYNHKKRPSASKKDTPKTSATAITTTHRQKNLTLSDWLLVFQYIDEHPNILQSQVVEHFKTRRAGALFFTQSTLSRKLEQRAELKARGDANPNALSSKRPRIVTRPDVERALVLWIAHMQENKEAVTGPMLWVKRKKFEEMLNVPEDEQLLGEGWVPSFCKAHKLKEFRRHGEASSADPSAVEAEQKRMQDLMKKFAPQDRWNFDETSLFLK